MASVLVIEDDQRIREALARGLAEAGHAVRTEATGGAALAAVVGWQPDVVVLDLGLPDLDGRDVLRMLRGVSAVPVIVATARDDEAQIVDLLDAGADDYVVKPYATAQMEARIRAVLRRGGQRDEPETEIRHGGLVLDLARRAASLDGRPLDLTRLEFDLLAYLARRSPEVVSRRELLAEV
jgi:DNA-binding response OmpR family regulator